MFLFNLLPTSLKSAWRFYFGDIFWVPIAFQRYHLYSGCDYGISLNILENAWINFSDYDRALNMLDLFDKFLKMPQAVNVSGFWIWHGFICKGYTQFCICPRMTQYASIIPEYASICLNKYVSEYAWKSLNKLLGYARVLNMPHYFRYLTGFWICRRH